MCVLVRVPTRVLTKDLECCNNVCVHDEFVHQFHAHRSLSWGLGSV